LISNHFRDSVGGPEKAGVGGSIPSLATNNFTFGEPCCWSWRYGACQLRITLGHLYIRLAQDLWQFVKVATVGPEKFDNTCRLA
jgi:hypothetical protein